MSSPASSPTPPAAAAAPESPPVGRRVVRMPRPRLTPGQQARRAAGAAPSARRAADALVVALPVALLAWLGYRRRWICDDALIVTRTVREILAGNGPVVSAGERAEAATSAAWEWLVALLAWFSGADPGRVAVWTGLLCGVSGYALALLGTRRLWRGGGDGDGAAPDADRHRQRPQLLLPVGILVPLAVSPVWNYLSSGLETGLETLWLGACWWLLVRTHEARRASSAGAAPLSLRACALVGLGPMVRPDLGIAAVLWFAALVLLGEGGRRGWARAALGAAVAGALPVAYEVFRMGYYGILVPLPALAKSAGSSYWARGLHYVQDFFDPYWLWGPVAALLVAALWLLGRSLAPAARAAGDRRWVLFGTPLATGLALSLYVVEIGGDFMHARMLLLPLLCLSLPLLLLPARPVAAVGGALLAVWTLLAVSPLRTPFDGWEYTANVRLADTRITGQLHPMTGEAWVRAFPALRRTVALAEANSAAGGLLYFTPGMSGYRLAPLAPGLPGMGQPLAVSAGFLGMTGALTPLDARVVDKWSLAYPLGAHFEEQRAAWPGHEKFVTDDWIFADYAAPSAVRLPGGPDPAQTAAARRALHCGALAELQHSVRDPLTPGRFWHNLLGAFDRTSLTVPRDPAAAERRFCH